LASFSAFNPRRAASAAAAALIDRGQGAWRHQKSAASHEDDEVRKNENESCQVKSS